jgi:hypothetical protein
LEGIGRSRQKLRIVRSLARARQDAFSFKEVEKITGVRKKHGLGVYLTQLVQSGCLRKDASTGQYCFFMRIFKEFAANRVVSMSVG